MQLQSRVTLTAMARREMESFMIDGSCRWYYKLRSKQNTQTQVVESVYERDWRRSSSVRWWRFIASSWQMKIQKNSNTYGSKNHSVNTKRRSVDFLHHRLIQEGHPEEMLDRVVTSRDIARGRYSGSLVVHLLYCSLASEESAACALSSNCCTKYY